MLFNYYFYNQKFYKCSLIKKTKELLMINENIRKGLLPQPCPYEDKECKEKIENLESPYEGPKYFVVINNILQKSECNQDSIRFELLKINKDIYDVINDAKYSLNNLLITGNTEMIGDFFATKLIGYENHVETKTNNTEQQPDSSHYIEVIQTPLNEKIELNFNYEYKKKDNEDEVTEAEPNMGFKHNPSVIVNVDKETKSLFRKISLEYVKNKAGNFIGVIIYFENLKKKSKYPDIKITIIGDEIIETPIEEENGG